MKRMKLEVIFHVADSTLPQTFADRLVDYMSQFSDVERSRNDKGPHYESCVVSMETKKWEEVR